jgi:hypothetical protein
LSVRRAFAVVKRQSMVALAALRHVSQAAIVRRTVAGSARRRSKHWVETTAHSLSAMLSQLPCLGV